MTDFTQGMFLTNLRKYLKFIGYDAETVDRVFREGNCHGLSSLWSWYMVQGNIDNDFYATLERVITWKEEDGKILNDERILEFAENLVWLHRGPQRFKLYDRSLEEYHQQRTVKRFGTKTKRLIHIDFEFKADELQTAFQSLLLPNIAVLLSKPGHTISAMLKNSKYYIYDPNSHEKAKTFEHVDSGFVKEIVKDLMGDSSWRHMLPINIECMQHPGVSGDVAYPDPEKFIHNLLDLRGDNDGLVNEAISQSHNPNALVCAASMGHVSIVKRILESLHHKDWDILEKRQFVTGRGISRGSPLFQAIRFGHDDVALLLLQELKRLDNRIFYTLFSEGERLFPVAATVFYNNTKLLNIFLAELKDEEDSVKIKCLSSTAYDGTSEFFSAGMSSPNVFTLAANLGDTEKLLLILSVVDNIEDRVELLSQKDGGKKTAMDYALENKNIELVTLLINIGMPKPSEEILMHCDPDIQQAIKHAQFEPDFFDDYQGLQMQRKT